MKKVKMTAMAMAVAMMMSLCCPVYAAAPTGANTETKTVKVTNVEGASNVTAYRIVEPDFSGGKFSGYVRANGITNDMLQNIEQPTSQEITNLAKAIKRGNLPVSEAWIYDGHEYSSEADARAAAR